MRMQRDTPPPSRFTRSFRDARPAVPRPLPRRRHGPVWPRVLSSLLLIAALAAALLAAAPLLTGRPSLALNLPSFLPAFFPTETALGQAARARSSSPALSDLVRGAAFTVSAGGHRWPIARTDLATMLHPAFSPGAARLRAEDRHVDRAAVAAYVARQSATLDRPGQDAAVLYDGGVVRVRDGRDGQIVDRAAATDRLLTVLRQGNRATIVWPMVDSPTVTNGEARAMADKLRRTLRTTVVWLPTRHWALMPSQIAAALTLRRVTTPTAARLVAHLDPAALAAGLPGSAQLATMPARDARIVTRGGRGVVIPAVEGRRPNYVALAAEMLRSPLSRAVYHLPLTVYQPARADHGQSCGARQCADPRVDPRASAIDGQDVLYG